MLPLTKPFTRTQMVRFYCEKTRFQNTLDALKKTIPSVEHTKQGISNLAQGAKLAVDETKGRVEDINKAIMDSKNAVVETANSAKKMFKIASLVMILCGSLFALGLAAESVAKIFESYYRIKKVVKGNQPVE